MSGGQQEADRREEEAKQAHAEAAAANSEAAEVSAAAAKARDKQTQLEVGKFKANAFGLHDMHGNMAELCADWFQPDYYTQSPSHDPTGPTSGVHNNVRGSCYIEFRHGFGSECAHRGWQLADTPYVYSGLRAVRTICGERPGPLTEMKSHSWETVEQRSPKRDPISIVAT